MSRILVTGGAGFIGSHIAEAYADEGHEVVILDNLSRAQTLPTASAQREIVEFNWNFLSRRPNVRLIRGDIRDADAMLAAAEGCSAIFHTAAQVAVTSSVSDPRTDFETNALGTFNVLEAARRRDVPAVAYCSTNKVYGENVNAIPIRESAKRYEFSDPALRDGVPETLSIDHCEHTPYGVSKLAADLYAQDYGHLYGVRTGVFRMSCIYGTRQFGNEDQGWLAHFILTTLRGAPVTIYGDGKQIRDALFVKDAVRAYRAFIEGTMRHGVWNLGGGPRQTTSLLELLDMIEHLTGRRSPLRFGTWRPSDQRVYVSDIRKAEKELAWTPTIGVEEGVRRFIDWYSTQSPWAQPAGL